MSASVTMRPAPPQVPSGTSVGKTHTRLGSRGREPSSASSTASVTASTIAWRRSGLNWPSGTDATKR